MTKIKETKNNQTTYNEIFEKLITSSERVKSFGEAFSDAMKTSKFAATETGVELDCFVVRIMNEIQTDIDAAADAVWQLKMAQTQDIGLILSNE